MNCQKHLFSLRENEHYLNCAYKAPLLRSAELACMNSLIRERNPMDIDTDCFFEETQLVRQCFAELINAPAIQISISPSASYGFSSILNNVKAKVGGNAITIEDEFPSGYFALEKWCRRTSNDLIVVRPTNNESIGRSWNDNILEKINDQTSIVLMSSVHWMNGIKFNLEAIGSKCREVGAKFIVDGTQSVGAIEMDVNRYNIDGLVCAGYKWLMGPYSIALTYFSEDFNEGVPIEEAWLNRKNSNQFSQLANYEKNYGQGATRYNSGETSNFILMPILRESLRQILLWKPSNIEKYCGVLIQPLIEYLNGLDVSLEEEAFFSNHILSLKLPANINMDKLNSNLIRNKVHLSMRGKNLRVSVNVFNDSRDINKLIHTIDETKLSTT